MEICDKQGSGFTTCVDDQLTNSRQIASYWCGKTDFCTTLERKGKGPHLDLHSSSPSLPKGPERHLSRLALLRLYHSTRMSSCNLAARKHVATFSLATALGPKAVAR